MKLFSYFTDVHHSGIAVWHADRFLSGSARLGSQRVPCDVKLLTPLTQIDIAH